MANAPNRLARSWLVSILLFILLLLVFVAARRRNNEIVEVLSLAGIAGHIVYTLMRTDIAQAIEWIRQVFKAPNLERDDVFIPAIFALAMGIGLALLDLQKPIPIKLNISEVVIEPSVARTVDEIPPTEQYPPDIKERLRGNASRTLRFSICTPNQSNVFVYANLEMVNSESPALSPLPIACAANESAPQKGFVLPHGGPGMLPINEVNPQVIGTGNPSASYAFRVFGQPGSRVTYRVVVQLAEAGRKEPIKDTRCSKEFVVQF